MEKRYFIIVSIVLLLICSSIIFMACGSNSYDIPNGTYKPCDENGNFYFDENGNSCTEEKSESYPISSTDWVLYNGSAMYDSSKLTIIEVDNQIYFEEPKNDSTTGYNVRIFYQYKVEYDNSSKILTVYGYNNLEKRYYRFIEE